jgi:hypothetical protein
VASTSASHRCPRAVSKCAPGAAERRPSATFEPGARVALSRSDHHRQKKIAGERSNRSRLHLRLDPLEQAVEKTSVQFRQRSRGVASWRRALGGEEKSGVVGVTAHPIEVIFDDGPHASLGRASALELGDKALLVELEGVDKEIGDEIFLAGKVVVDAPNAGVRRFADVTDRRRGEPSAGEAAQGRVEDLGTPAERGFAGLPRALRHGSSVFAAANAVKGCRVRPRRLPSPFGPSRASGIEALPRRQ